MIKVPATPAGLPAIGRLVAEGINVNVTLLFARDVYEAAADAYIGGLEQRAAAGESIRELASVASFFVSRIDTLIDGLVDERMASTTTAEERRLLRSVLGKVGVANAKLAYVAYRRIFSGERWQALAAKGAHTQRVLWASTSTKNPNYPKTLYVDELIGPDTVNTLPPETLTHFREHGCPRSSLTEGIQDAEDTLARLAEAEISMEKVTAQLLEDGVKLFADAFDKLLGAIRTKGQAVLEAARG
jgi:transaldolase/glucose-6-phosphate isomerase